MADINNENNNDLESKNIFDDFSDDSGLIDEVNSVKNKKNKDMFFYFQKTGGILQVIFWPWLIILGILSTYIYAQNNVELKDSNILNPFCSIILWDIENPEYNSCSSITHIEEYYSKKLFEIKTEQTSFILDIIIDLYSFENFSKSKEILFLLDKTNNKLPVLWILEQFDNLKNEFNDLDKQKIQCNSIYIDAEKSLLSMSCIAYSAWFERWLRWFDGTDDFPLKGTSVSIANSFLNFINKKSDIFNVVNRQKVFSSTSSLWADTDFTNQTSFKLQLEYNLQ